jgi:hypothetical protein
VGTHRDREIDEHAHGFAGAVLGIEPEQRSQEVWAIRQARSLLVDHFDLVALQYGDIHELSGFVAAAVLDNQQTGRDHLQHDAKRRQVARSTPDEELLTVAPDAEVNARSNCRGDFTVSGATKASEMRGM